MVTELKQQQKDEVKHRDFCVEEFAENEKQTAIAQDELSDLGSLQLLEWYWEPDNFDVKSKVFIVRQITKRSERGIHLPRFKTDRFCSGRFHGLETT